MISLTVGAFGGCNSILNCFMMTNSLISLEDVFIVLLPNKETFEIMILMMDFQ